MGLENCYVDDWDILGVRDYKIIKGNEKGYFRVVKYDVDEYSFLQLKVIN